MVTRRLGRFLIGIFLVAALVALAWWGLVAAFPGIDRSWQPVPSCEVKVGERTFQVDPDQMANVATITGVALRRKLPARAATIALATARQESKFRNIDYGDRDSLGLFQQRPTQGWGTPKQIMDPVYASNAFYDALVKIDDYESQEITMVAQEVQRSAYPQAYADHEAEGRAFASVLAGYSPAGLTCQLAPPTGDGEASRTRYRAALKKEQVNVPAKEIDGGVVGIRLTAPDQRTAWSLAQWTVAGAERFGVTRVTVAGRMWDRKESDDEWVTVPTKNTTQIDVLWETP
ncbi:MAG: hypothetical protein ACRCTR_05545 [Actinomycetota bacterium]